MPKRKAPYGLKPSGTVKMGGAYLPLYSKRRKIASQNRSTYQFGRIEDKFLDTVINISPVQNINTTSTSLVQIPEGTSPSERIGRKATITKIFGHIIIDITNSTNAAENSNVFRLLVVQDKQANGTAYQLNEVLLSTPGVFVNNFRDLTRSGRFNVLMDKVVTLSRDAGAYNGTTNVFAEKKRYLNFSRKVNIPIEFSGSTGGVSEMRSNNIAFIAVATDANTGVIASSWRIRYTDM